MKNKFIFIVILFFQLNLYGQLQTISSVGETFINDKINLSWTMGETIIDTYTSGDISLTQGFHQSQLNLTPTFAPDRLCKLRVFPNPANEYINLEFDSNAPLPSMYYILDIKGSLMQQGRIQNEKCKINTYNLNAGIYFLSFNNKGKLLFSNVQFNKF